jgi:ATP-dependent Clp protease adapter protein ClpS
MFPKSAAVEMPDTITKERQESDVDEEIILPRKVVLHNCDCHDFLQVIVALVKALAMSVERAHQMAWTVHLTGSAVVYEGDLERCELIAKEIEAWAGLGSTGLPLKVTVEE